MQQSLVKRIILGCAVFGSLFLFFLWRNADGPVYLRFVGETMGTTYLVHFAENQEGTFLKPLSYKEMVEEILQEVNQSVSTYIPNSVISALNEAEVGQWVEVDPIFKDLWLLAYDIHEKTQGYFDPRVGKWVDAAGFGPSKEKLKATRDEVLKGPKDSPELLEFQFSLRDALVWHDTNPLVVQKTEAFNLDFSAIAKGYAVDLIKEKLLSVGVQHYLVEIGGELCAEGRNKSGYPWMVAIEDPETKKPFRQFGVEKGCLATSGAYQQRRVIQEKTVTHIANPVLRQSAAVDGLESVTVWDEESCAQSDAYATAFFAMGQPKAIAFAERFRFAILTIDDGVAKKSEFFPY